METFGLGGGGEEEEGGVGKRKVRAWRVTVWILLTLDWHVVS